MLHLVALPATWGIARQLKFSFKYEDGNFEVDCNLRKAGRKRRWTLVLDDIPTFP